MVLERLDDLRVAELEQAAALLDDRDLAAERGEHRRVLDADHAGADDDAASSGSQSRPGCRRSRGRGGRRTRRSPAAPGACRRRSRSSRRLTPSAPRPTRRDARACAGRRSGAWPFRSSDVVARELGADDVDLALRRRAACGGRGRATDLVLDAVALAVDAALAHAGQVERRPRAASSTGSCRCSCRRRRPSRGARRGDAPAELGGLDRGLLAGGAGADHHEVVVVGHALRNRPAVGWLDGGLRPHRRHLRGDPPPRSPDRRSRSGGRSAARGRS